MASVLLSLTDPKSFEIASTTDASWEPKGTMSPLFLIYVKNNMNLVPLASKDVTDVTMPVFSEVTDEQLC